ncbi:MAG: DNA polymerase III subunit delta [Coriobacteriia bacterium]|nr:DNA polymerase III subunit delta [Coriobacteriia bacterium]
MSSKQLAQGSEEPPEGNQRRHPIEPPFTNLVGQPLVARFLTAACAGKTPSHAYLFLGPLGAGKTEAAHALASALLCPQGGCGSCDECIRVAHRTHPDYHIIEPLGAAGYLAEQAADLIHDVSLAPIRASRKIYLITRADLLKGAAANALLKTIEEPYENVSFILLARTRDAVLPTLLSRCQALPFRQIPESEATCSLMERTGVDEAMARRAFAAAGGSRLRAEEFIMSRERRQTRIALIEMLERLPLSDDLDVLEAVKSLFVRFKQPLDAVKVEQQLQRDASKDFLSKGSMTALEQQHKRELTSRERETIGEALDVIRSYLRDILLVRLGKANEIVNDDFYFHIEKFAVTLDEAAITRSLIAVDRAQEQIQYNSKELALEALFFVVRDELTHKGLT